MRRTLTIIGLIALIGFSYKQVVTNQDEIIQKLEDYMYNFPQEKVYLHLDKPYYTPNQQIWFKAYLINAFNPSDAPLSEVVEVDLIGPDGRILANRKIKLSKQGGAGNIFLSDTLKSGDYTIRGYTNWNKNFDESFFYSKTFRVLDSQLKESTEPTSIPEIKVSFFPEGGALISNVPTIVGFKALDSNGYGIDVSGDVINQNGQVVGSFDSFRNGMGKFILTPSSNQQYSAVVSFDNSIFRFPLPSVTSSGYVIKATHRHDSEKVILSVYTPNRNLAGGFLLGHQNGRQFLKVFPTQKGLSATIDKLNFPPGICHLTFFDADGVPRSERILTINIPEETHALDIEQPRTYNTREKVSLKLQSKIDKYDSAAYQNLSVAVTPRSQVDLPKYGQNIKNFLLLSSDLRGFIEEPEFYFSGTAEAYELLEVLMLTQGWRRFVWKDVLHEENQIFDHAPEYGIRIGGQLSANKRQKGVNGKVSLSVMDDKFQFLESTANENGLFLFEGLEFYDSTELLFEGKRFIGKKGKVSNDVLVSLTPDLTYPVPPNFLQPTGDRISDKVESATLEQQQKIESIDRAFQLDDQLVILDEVEVEAVAPIPERIIEFKKYGMLYASPSNRLIIDSVNTQKTASTIFDLVQAKIPGIQVRGDFPFQFIQIRNGVNLQGIPRQPMYMLNGNPVDVAVLSEIPPGDIAFVDVLKGPRTVLYGPQAANGVFAVYTRTGTNQRARKYIAPKNTLKITYPGFSVAKEFYSPDYEVFDQGASKPDYRTTLFWDPEVIVTEKSDSIVFFTSDQKGVFDIVIEGITSKGEPIHQKEILNVQ